MRDFYTSLTLLYLSLILFFVNTIIHLSRDQAEYMACIFQTCIVMIKQTVDIQTPSISITLV